MLVYLKDLIKWQKDEKDGRNTLKKKNRKAYKKQRKEKLFMKFTKKVLAFKQEMLDLIKEVFDDNEILKAHHLV